ncbi:alpha/beta fold hydrolase [Tsukamurella tyrosinosolvens]|uniref:alpha/beta fold hydrolase n=1 Tax=Tsukamurella tyrosinosolvens TaxID=57704 RepID=UPI001374F907|nr:alpha/beta fold hydrolase [Tsukamurella tyrosinosolvens]
MGSEFSDAYDAVVAQWGVPVRRTDVDGPLARTRVLIAGDDDAPPLLCLPGGRDTGASWFGQAATLAASHRVLAPDLPGDAGGSERRGLRSRDDLPAWIDEVLDGLGATTADLLGYSLGAQIAVAYALARPDRVRALTVLDPTRVFASMRITTALRAVPVMAAPSSRRARAYATWETAGHWPPTPEFGRLASAAADGPRPRYAVPPQPRPDDLDALRELPGGVTVVVALRSRYHDGAAVTRTVERRYPWMRVETLPVSHHELPFAYRP